MADFGGQRPQRAVAYLVTTLVGALLLTVATLVSPIPWLAALAMLAIGFAIQFSGVFGSYVSDVAEPNEVDVILVMQDDFRLASCPAESLVLFDHSRADAELGASVFWVRPGMLLGEPLEQFLAHWERKRDGRRRGIVEIRP